MIFLRLDGIHQGGEGLTSTIFSSSLQLNVSCLGFFFPKIELLMIHANTENVFPIREEKKKASDFEISHEASMIGYNTGNFVSYTSAHH